MVCALLLSQTITASSQTRRPAVPAASTPQPLQGFNLNFGFCKEIALTAVAVGAVVGVGLYLLLRKGPGITGCTVENAGGRQIRHEADQRTYTLSGRTAPLRSDERVRVFGKKQKRSSTDSNFVVKKSSKPIGACTAAPSHRAGAVDVAKHSQLVDEQAFRAREESHCPAGSRKIMRPAEA